MKIRHLNFGLKTKSAFEVYPPAINHQNQCRPQNRLCIWCGHNFEAAQVSSCSFVIEIMNAVIMKMTQQFLWYYRRAIVNNDVFKILKCLQQKHFECFSDQVSPVISAGNNTNCGIIKIFWKI